MVFPRGVLVVLVVGKTIAKSGGIELTPSSPGSRVIRMKRSKTVDDYIRECDNWQSELTRLREILATTNLSEEIKWGAPCYTCDGKNIVGIAAFKSYFGLWFHQGALLKDEGKHLVNAQEGKTKALRQWRMKSASDIKAKVIKSYVNEAMQLAREGKGIAPQRKKTLTVPAELERALLKDSAASKAFKAMTPGRQREYADYVADAKREETRERRVARILPMIRSGVGLNDRYRSA